MGYKATLSKVIESLVQSYDATSDEGKLARSMLKSIENDLASYDKNPQRAETLLVEKLKILKEVIEKEVSYLEPHITNKLILGEDNGYPGGVTPKQ